MKTDDLDLDLHATPISDICDLSEVVVEQSITWCNLRTPWGLHSGDFTSGDPFGDGKGAQEFVVIDKSLAKKHNIDYILFDVYGYNAGLNTDDSIRALFMEREGSLSDLPHKFKRDTRPVFCGEVVEPSTFEESVKLQAKEIVSSCSPTMCRKIILYGLMNRCCLLAQEDSMGLMVIAQLNALHCCTLSRTQNRQWGSCLQPMPKLLTQRLLMILHRQIMFLHINLLMQ